MKKEQHIYKIQESDERGIVYVFNITRKAKAITLDSIWLVVIHNGIETKIILNIPAIMAEILITPEQDAELNVKEVIAHWFSDMKLAKDEMILVDIEEQIEIPEVEGKTNYDDIVKELLSGNTKKNT